MQQTNRPYYNLNSNYSCSNSRTFALTASTTQCILMVMTTASLNALETSEFSRPYR